MTDKIFASDPVSLSDVDKKVAIRHFAKCITHHRRELMTPILTPGMVVDYILRLFHIIFG